MTCHISVKTYLTPAIPGHPAESTKTIDHDDSSDRKWLASHCFWAMRNGRTVISIPLEPVTFTGGALHLLEDFKREQSN